MSASAFRGEVLVFDGVEELDAIGPWEVLRLWATLSARDIDIRTVSLDGDAVRCGMGLRIIPDAAFGDGSAPDVFIHPGGPGSRILRRDDSHLERMRALHQSGVVVASVCTGAQVLASAGLLDGLVATSHWRILEDLRAEHPGVTFVEDARWVDQGSIVTSGGMSAGIDMALHLVDRFESSQMAVRIARILEHPWQDRV